MRCATRSSPRRRRCRYTLDGVRSLADAGVGAIVLFSLFEEQLREEAARDDRLVDGPAESFAEALDYVPAVVKEDAGPRRYLSLLERAVAAVDVPVIASLNGATPEGWTDYARAMQDAGAAAIELNIYYLPGDPHITGRDVEQRHVDVLQRVKDAVTIPVAVKLSPYFSSTGEVAHRLDDAGRRRARAVQPLPAAGHRSRGARHRAQGHAVTPGGRPPAADVDRAAARQGPRRARGHHRRRGRRRRRQLPARRCRRRDDDLGAAAPRTPSTRRVLLDGLSAWMARNGFQTVDELRGMLAVPADRRPGRLRARRLRQRDARGQRPRPRPVVTIAKSGWFMPVATSRVEYRAATPSDAGSS